MVVALTSAALTVAQPPMPAAAEICVLHTASVFDPVEYLNSPCWVSVDEDEILQLVEDVIDQCLATTCADVIATIESLAAMAIGIVSPLPAWCLETCVGTATELAAWAAGAANEVCEGVSTTNEDCAALAVNFTLRVVNDILLPAVMSAPETAMELAGDVLVLANQYIAEVTAQVGPTAQFVEQQVWATVDSIVPTLNYVVGLVPAPDELVTLATELAGMVVGMVPPAPGTDAIFDLAGDLTGGGEADGQTNTGVKPDPPATNPLGEGDVFQAFDKLFVAHQMQADVVAALAVNSTPTTEDAEIEPGPFGCYYRPFAPWIVAASMGEPINTTAAWGDCPTNSVPQAPPSEPAPSKDAFKQDVIADQNVYVQEKPYTCGPSSARALLEQMTGVLHSEATMAQQMGTTTQGSDNPSWARVVNSHQTKARFRVDRATSAEQLMTRVIYDVSGQEQPYHREGEYSARHSMGLNLNHTVLFYWGRAYEAGAGHFVLASGYSTADGGMIRLSDGGNHEVAGHHPRPLEEVWRSQTGHFLGGRTVW